MMRRMWMACTVATLMSVTFSGVALGQAASPAPASPAAASTVDALAKEVQASYARVKSNILKSADKMPPEDYSFKPTPDIRTFARVVNHVTEAQMHICGALNQVKPGDAATVPPETADKGTIVDALKASFAECDKAYAALTDANMTEMFQLGPAKRSRLGLLWGNVGHDNEQYATLAIYMRLKGQIPPSSEK
jgi:DinB superfamily